MKTTDRLLEVADLKAVGHFEDELVLFIAAEDPNIPTSLCIQADFSSKIFYAAQPMSEYLKLHSYLHIHDGDMRISYRQRILEEMDPAATAAMLSELSQKRRKMSGKENIEGWEPSWEHPTKV